MSEQNLCPCCGRHCDLSDPHCERGVEYLRTGKIPERRPGEGHHGHHRPAPYRSLDTDDKLVEGLRDLNRIMRTQYEGKASQQRALMMLNSEGPMTQRDMTERLEIQPGSASELLSKLENAGLIRRTPNETDRRTVDIQLTDAGKAMAQEAVEQRHKRHEEMFACLSEEEKQTLLSLMEKLRNDWKARFFHHGRHGQEGHPHDHHGHRGDGDREMRG